MLNTLNATSAKYIAPILGDTVMKPSPAFWGLQRVAKHWAGGGQIVYSEITTEEMTGGSYWGDQLLNTTIVDSVQPANQEWRFYYQAIVIPLSDVILNGGLSNSLSLVKVKFQVASASLLQKLSRAMWGTAPQNTSTDIDSLVSWVQTTNNVIAGIDRSVAANSFWLPAANQNVGAALSLSAFETGYQSVVYGYAEPDTMLLNNTQYGNFKNQLVSNIRYVENVERNDAAIQMNFRNHFVVNNATVLQDRFVPTGTGFLLNSDYIFPVFNEQDYFTVDPFVKPSNQRVVIAYINVAWQLVCPSPRMNVAYTNVT
jgi:hypothetical protein